MQKLSKKIGLIVGAGQLPFDLLSARNSAITDFFAIGIKGVCDNKILEICDIVVGLGDIGKIINILKQEDINKLAIIGYIKRPDFSNLSLDFVGLKLLPKLIAAAKIGDDAIMRIVIAEFEKNKIEIIAPETLFLNIKASSGALGKYSPSESDLEDINKAILIANDLGKYDIGQAIIVVDGCVLAIEAQEGTDEMLKRVASLPSHFIGKANAHKGILLKAPKTIQDIRIDLPAIGISTLEYAIKANLSGIAFFADKAIIAQKEELIKCANENGLFLYGIEASNV